MSKYMTAPVPTNSLPKGIPYIIGNEAAERFSFYGMKGILVMFMTSYLWIMSTDPAAVAMQDAEARAWYHLFTGAVYLTPFLGAIIADAFLGKYLTIMSLSIVYVLGHGLLALMGAHLPGSDTQLSANLFLFLGLALIAIGSGGIKPCVSAHVGDQFGQTNAHWLSKVFGWFYVAINLGAFLSNLLTPWLLNWYGPHFAFGVPGVLMAIATFVFWLGRNRFIHVQPGGFAFLREVFSRAGLSSIVKLLFIYVFVAVFWALFDQTGSSWVLQAENMNRDWLGFVWLESQIQAVNPIMILILVPLFGFLVYPAIDKVFKMTPIRKIAIGLFLMVPGFAVVALIQNWIDAGETPSIAWQVLAYVILTASEVMVSITCLEFSYTQAPRRMKSLIMAAFLASVTLGNFFTAGVNWYIQVPTATAQAESAASIANQKRAAATASETHATDVDVQSAIDKGLEGHKATYASTADKGFSINVAWPTFTGGDGITLAYNEQGAQVKVDAEGVGVVESGAKEIEKAWKKNEEKLPNTETGTKIVESIKDPWGHSLRYLMKSGTEARVSSDGPDGVPLTLDDINDRITIIPPAAAESALSWRQRALAARAKRFDTTGDGAKSGVEVDGQTFDTAIAIGGGDTLEGANYFWFFVVLMLATAVCFIPVGILYRPKEYLQEEQGVTDEEAISEAIGDQ